MMTLAGRRGLQAHEPSDPKDVVSRLEAICKLMFPREIQVMANIDARTGLVAMSTSDLEQVLLNLLFNARDAVLEAQGGQRQIRVLVDRIGLSAGLYQTRIRVTDTGIGMTEAVREQIFVPFFTTKPPNLASGLGLANALSRVRDAGGRLDCESEPGRGTTFTLLLPEAARDRRSLRPPSKPETTADGVEAILVVDDEPPVRAVTARLLKSAGYEVLETGSAHEARESLRENGRRIKLILLDQSMPLESGLEALSSLQRLCSAPVVLFSGLTSKLPLGVTALLQKPTRSAELLQLVREVLNTAS